MSSIMDQIKQFWSYLPLNLEKLLKLNLFTLASRNIYQSAPNLFKMYVKIRSRMSLIINLIGAELSDLFAFDFAESDFVYTLASTYVDQ